LTKYAECSEQLLLAFYAIMVYISKQFSKNKKGIKKTMSNMKTIKLVKRPTDDLLADLTSEQVARIGELALMQ